MFVYPFVKTRDWYQLPQGERQAMMDEHIRVGRKYPSVKLNTTYSYGLDDQEFVVSFETDEPADFLDLVMELRETKTSVYTLRDTPIFTCIADVPARDAGHPRRPRRRRHPADSGAARGGGRLGAESPQSRSCRTGAAAAVYFRGEQVALFNLAGRIYAVANRCSHANGPLVEGAVDGGCVTCPSTARASTWPPASHGAGLPRSRSPRTRLRWRTAPCSSPPASPYTANRPAAAGPFSATPERRSL